MTTYPRRPLTLRVRGTTAFGVVHRRVAVRWFREEPDLAYYRVLRGWPSAVYISVTVNQVPPRSSVGPLPAVGGGAWTSWSD